MCVHTRVKLMEEITPFIIYGGIDTFVIVLIGQFFDETTENFIEMNRCIGNEPLFFLLFHSLAVVLAISFSIIRFGQIKLSIAN